ncbi:hypothetical protein QF032_007252 [Streptomyces achromogenes]|uniref:Uncharacterized protein n=1 Tax=Streptomyces achromogenes TaxID=67255 RepID=A0ABU0QDF1_STRAH|nr:hypothetical protein [Streptomyces achromogenes]MDQ0835408.1 hypothetical protein [Streptomyces achromogenes]
MAGGSLAIRATRHACGDSLRAARKPRLKPGWGSPDGRSPGAGIPEVPVDAAVTSACPCPHREDPEDPEM